MFRANKEAQLASRPLADRLEDAEDADSIEELEPRSRRRRCLASRWFKLSCYGVLFVVSHLVASQIGALLAISSIDVDRECAAHTTQWCRFPSYAGPSAAGLEIDTLLQHRCWPTSRSGTNGSVSMGRSSKKTSTVRWHPQRSTRPGRRSEWIVRFPRLPRHLHSLTRMHRSSGRDSRRGRCAKRPDISPRPGS